MRKLMISEIMRKFVVDGNVRKFIISDINGFPNLYYSVMNYLDSISQTDDVELYINGNLVGMDSENLPETQLLYDLQRRMNSGNKKFKIIYLAGNHEIELYKRLLESGQEKFTKPITDFLGELPIYHRFEETINSKRIVLANAACPFVATAKCNIFVKDINSGDKQLVSEIMKCTNTKHFTQYDHIGNRNYFSIVGHNPNNDPKGYEYNPDGDYLNIDGGSDPFQKGFAYYNHFPLVELKVAETKNEEVEDDNGKRELRVVAKSFKFKILTFNSKNKIVLGHYFYGGRSIPLSDGEIREENKRLKVGKQMIRDEYPNKKLR